MWSYQFKRTRLGMEHLPRFFTRYRPKLPENIIIISCTNFTLIYDSCHKIRPLWISVLGFRHRNMFSCLRILKSASVRHQCEDKGYNLELSLPV
jgi:hypothetical protein